jgi:hypothetical protein
VHDLSFDEASHTYRLGGVIVPSVTQVLKVLDDTFDRVPFDVLEAAREFGQHVHKTVELDSLGQLDEDSLDPALAEYLAGWRKFLADRTATVIASEVRVASRRLRYAGTLDAIVEMNGLKVLVDIKSGEVPKTVGPQTAAYEFAARESGLPDQLGRMCVQLMPNDFKATAMRDRGDWNAFVSALNVYRWRNPK